MPDLSKWRGNERQVISNIVPAERAVDAWQRVQRDPTEITIVRHDTTLAAQTVRVVMGTETNEREGQVGATLRRMGVVFGVRGHATVADTDIRADDRFALNVGTDAAPRWIQFTVLDVDYRPGEVQARVEQNT